MPTTNDAASPRPHPRPDARLGALVEDDGTRFRVWSPSASSLTVVLESGERLEMTPRSDDIFEAFSPGATTGVRYRIELDGDEAFPDPASRYQPDGVHGASSIVDPSAYAWSDGQWEGASREDLVFYEIHTGTFTPEGTFEGIRSRLPYLRDLGVTALELMPVADFPGRWNWGYDHAALYAPSRAYGTPDELRRLVDEAHEMGLAVFLDVIYNHLGPDGAYVAAFAPMFTDRHETPWGQAVNLDDQYSAGVRGLFIDNALSWLLEYHVDGLRLDATHALVDESEVHFLEELQETVERIGAGPERLLIAEDHRNENRIVRPRAEGGYGLAAVWADDFHHQIRNLTAGDEDGYYVDYAGTTTRDLAETINRGWFYDGRLSNYSGKPRGTDPSPVQPSQCVVCIQNHDQVGNRPTGRRLNRDIPPNLYRTVSAVLLFAPELPLLFMGQEWAASTPFQFFTNHDEPLGALVSEGRKEEFRSFAGFQGDVPDPQDPETYYRSRLDWQEAEREGHAGTLALYRDLLHLRPELPSEARAAAAGPSAIIIRRGSFVLYAALEGGITLKGTARGDVELHTEDRRYGGSGHQPRVADDAITFSEPAAIVVST